METVQAVTILLLIFVELLFLGDCSITPSRISSIKWGDTYPIRAFFYTHVFSHF